MVQLLFVAATINAFEWPFKLPWVASTASDQVVFDTPVDAPSSSARPPRVAIIGAGAGGSSAAYWLSLGKKRANITFDIDVYERSDYIGGRSTIVFPYGNADLPHVELGGSIFVDANKNMMRAAKTFGLDIIDSDLNLRNELGIWDGQQFVFRTETTGVGSWWGKLSALWRYGFSAPAKVDSIVKNMLVHFLKLYNHDFETWKDIPAFAAQVKLLDTVAQTGAEYFDTHGVGLRYSRELIEAATRVNYGQNIDNIHGFGGLVSMSADAASTVTSGNRAIFAKFIEASTANVLLNTTVTSIHKKTSPLAWQITTSNGLSQEYDAVVIAAPLPFANLQFEPTLQTKIPQVPYVHLHVTLLTTTAKHPNPEYFGFPRSKPVPRTVLTTYDGVRNGGREPEFNSLNYIRPLKEGGDEWVVKIFSNSSLSDEWLEEVFSGEVGWVLRKEWDAYPRLDPRTPDAFPPVQLDESLFYVNALEPFISTMETETVAARNVAELLLQNVYSSSICPTKASEPGETPTIKENYVHGFDCPYEE